MQREIGEALERLPKRDWQVSSLCAGDGRDLVGALAGHPRARDVHGLLVELDPQLAQAARDTHAGAGLANIEVRIADAGDVVHYRERQADLLLVCGVMGNVTDEGVLALIAQLPLLCAPGATLVWTRHRRPPDLTPSIRAALAEVGFAEIAFHALASSWMSVGSARFEGIDSLPVRAERLFTFTADEAQEWQTAP